MRERWPATSIDSMARCAVMRSAVPAPRAVYCRIMSAPSPSLAGAVFLDLYGTVAREVGYINHPDRFRLHDFSGEAIRLLNGAGYRVFVATNQSGIARGYFTEDVLNEVHGRLVRRLARESARIEAVYYCPHLPPVGGGRGLRLPQAPSRDAHAGCPRARGGSGLLLDGGRHDHRCGKPDTPQGHAGSSCARGTGAARSNTSSTAGAHSPT